MTSRGGGSSVEQIRGNIGKSGEHLGWGSCSGKMVLNLVEHQDIGLLSATNPKPIGGSYC